MVALLEAGQAGFVNAEELMQEVHAEAWVYPVHMLAAGMGARVASDPPAQDAMATLRSLQRKLRGTLADGTSAASPASGAAQSNKGAADVDVEK
eukprot:9230279-Prorocentrum_lima.AAC.1